MTTDGPRAAPPPGPWQTARILCARPEGARTRTLRLELERPTPYLPGQHFVVRLRAPDGYTASRSYSAASPPEPTQRLVELTVERLDDGEVSTFLHDVAAPGDALEVRGPIGGWFVWNGERPALLVGGGTGLVPLVAMLRQARRVGPAHVVRLVASVRSPEECPFRSELAGPDVTVVYTRRAPPGLTRTPGRLRADDLAPVLADGDDVFVCGSNGFCDAVTALLVDDLGVAPRRVRLERFGPTG